MEDRDGIGWGLESVLTAGDKRVADDRVVRAVNGDLQRSPVETTPQHDYYIGSVRRLLGLTIRSILSECALGRG